MKWLKIVLAVALIGVIIPLAVTPASPVSADVTNADVLITVTPGFGIPGLITNFTLTDLGSITVTANWTPGSANATHTVIRASRVYYPASTSEGELMYYGENTTANWTGFNLDITRYYFSAWSYNSGSGLYSLSYATASVGGEDMDELIEVVGNVTDKVSSLDASFAGFSDYYGLIIAIFLMIIALWRRTWLFYIIAGFAWMIFGFQYWSENAAVSLLLVLLGIACFVGAKFDKGKQNA